MDTPPISIEQMEEPDPSPNEIDKPWGPGKKIDEETENRIAQLRLGGWGVRDVASKCNVSVGTVTNAYRRWLKANAGEALGDPRQLAMEVVTRLWQNANNARQDYLNADESKDRATLLNTERQAIMDIAKLVGIDINRIQIAGSVELAGSELDHRITQIMRELTTIEGEVLDDSDAIRSTPDNDDDD